MITDYLSTPRPTSFIQNVSMAVNLAKPHRLINLSCKWLSESSLYSGPAPSDCYGGTQCGPTSNFLWVDVRCVQRSSSFACVAVVDSIFQWLAIFLLIVPASHTGSSISNALLVTGSLAPIITYSI